ncbi:MAG: hypothetical protein LBE48_06335 [Methanomassiliicoccaceae archaeon]|nr:hypothetical protein [Methanomassiliicoccaceae archaeon]
MTLASELRKKRARTGLIFGAISGLVLVIALSIVSGFSPAYFVFVPIGAAVGAGQLYLMTPEE